LSKARTKSLDGSKSTIIERAQAMTGIRGVMKEYINGLKLVLKSSIYGDQILAGVCFGPGLLAS